MKQIIIIITALLISIPTHICAMRKLSFADMQLLEAAEHNDLPGVQKALKDGARPNAQKANGDTALHMTCNPEMAEFLLHARADVNAINARDKMPLDSVLLHASHAEKTDTKRFEEQYNDIKNTIALLIKARACVPIIELNKMTPRVQQLYYTINDQVRNAHPQDEHKNDEQAGQ